MENKIYCGWAYTENEQHKSKTNHETYMKIKEKVSKIELRSRGQWQITYNVYPKYNQTITGTEALLIADGGNLCFGGHCVGDVTGNEDETNYIVATVYID